MALPATMALPSLFSRCNKVAFWPSSACLEWTVTKAWAMTATLSAGLVTKSGFDVQAEEIHAKVKEKIASLEPVLKAEIEAQREKYALPSEEQSQEGMQLPTNPKLSMTDLKVKYEPYLLGGSMIVTLSHEWLDLQQSIFSEGDYVRLSDTQGYDIFYNGYVTQVLHSSMKVSLNIPRKLRSDTQLLPGVQVRLDKQFDPRTFHRMGDALKALLLAPGSQVQKQAPDFKAKSSHRAFHGTYLRDVLVSSKPGPLAAQPSHIMQTCAIDDRASLQHMIDAVYHTRLNQSQKDAILLALSQRMSLIQGPPGTGKTKATVAFVQFLKKNLNFRGKVLVCAQSNVAVDNLVEGLDAAGLNVVRIGDPSRVRDSLQRTTLEARMQADPKWMQRQGLEALTKQRERAERDMDMNDPALDLDSSSAKTRDQLELLDSVIQAAVLGSADVICATVSGAGCRELDDLHFPVVVMDEGSQCSELEALVAIMKKSMQVVLVGDEQQLPPIVFSKTAKEAGLEVSLFEQLKAKGVGTAFLEEQYRMHPAIAEFPNKLSYEGRLGNGVSAEERPPPSFPFPNPNIPVVFVQVDSPEKEFMDGSKSNTAQARMVVKYVRHLIHAGTSSEDIGVITPYAKQADLIRQLFQQAKFKSRRRRDEDSSPLVTTTTTTQAQTPPILAVPTTITAMANHPEPNAAGASQPTLTLVSLDGSRPSLLTSPIQLTPTAATASHRTLMPESLNDAHSSVSSTHQHSSPIQSFAILAVPSPSYPLTPAQQSHQSAALQAGRHMTALNKMLIASNKDPSVTSGTPAPFSGAPTSTDTPTTSTDTPTTSTDTPTTSTDTPTTSTGTSTACTGTSPVVSTDALNSNLAHPAATEAQTKSAQPTSFAASAVSSANHLPAAANPPITSQSQVAARPMDLQLDEFASLPLTWTGSEPITPQRSSSETSGSRTAQVGVPKDAHTLVPSTELMLQPSLLSQQPLDILSATEDQTLHADVDAMQFELIHHEASSTAHDQSVCYISEASAWHVPVSISQGAMESTWPGIVTHEDVDAARAVNAEAQMLRGDATVPTYTTYLALNVGASGHAMHVAAETRFTVPVVVSSVTACPLISDTSSTLPQVMSATDTLQCTGSDVLQPSCAACDSTEALSPVNSSLPVSAEPADATSIPSQTTAAANTDTMQSAATLHGQATQAADERTEEQSQMPSLMPSTADASSMAPAPAAATHTQALQKSVVVPGIAPAQRIPAGHASADSPEHRPVHSESADAASGIIEAEECVSADNELTQTTSAAGHDDSCNRGMPSISLDIFTASCESAEPVGLQTAQAKSGPSGVADFTIPQAHKMLLSKDSNRGSDIQGNEGKQPATALLASKGAASEMKNITMGSKSVTATDSMALIEDTKLYMPEVNTVDGYQGREKDIVIFSTVRSNRGRRVGFLEDPRRLNVAITRAKNGLIIIGDAKTLDSAPHWAQYLTWLRDNGCIAHATDVLPKLKLPTEPLSDLASNKAAKVSDKPLMHGVKQQKQHKSKQPAVAASSVSSRPKPAKAPSSSSILHPKKAQIKEVVKLISSRTEVAARFIAPAFANPEAMKVAMQQQGSSERSEIFELLQFDTKSSSSSLRDRNNSTRLPKFTPPILKDSNSHGSSSSSSKRSSAAMSPDISRLSRHAQSMHGKAGLQSFWAHKPMPPSTSDSSASSTGKDRLQTLQNSRITCTTAPSAQPTSTSASADSMQDREILDKAGGSNVESSSALDLLMAKPPRKQKLPSLDELSDSCTDGSPPKQ